MSFSYDPTLPSNLDWVRFLIGDTDSTNIRLQDEEITSIIAEETATGKAVKYLAAAAALSSLHLRWSSAGGGLAEKEVDGLRLRWQGSMNIGNNSIVDRIKELRKIGASHLLNKPKFFRGL